MSFHGDRTRVAKPPSRLLPIPLALLAMAMTLPFLRSVARGRAYRHVPATRYFDGLPVAGRWADAPKSRL